MQQALSHAKRTFIGLPCVCRIIAGNILGICDTVHHYLCQIIFAEDCKTAPSFTILLLNSLFHFIEYVVSSSVLDFISLLKYFIISSDAILAL